MCFLDGFTGAYGMNSEKKYDATLKMVVSNMNLYFFVFFSGSLNSGFHVCFSGGVCLQVQGFIRFRQNWVSEVTSFPTS